MTVNDTSGLCAYCGNPVAARSGVVVTEIKDAWTLVRVTPRVAHLACRNARDVQVELFGQPGKSPWIQNINGICEDAPCCGCCSR
jgi:hypothetical protein